MVSRGSLPSPRPLVPAHIYWVVMAREPILQPSAEYDDKDRDLRPQHMQDMVGQREVYARLEIAVDAASKRGEPLGHILFDGPPGLGKTTFAMCIPPIWASVSKSPAARPWPPRKT